jgi:hypothetical protein
MPGGVERDRVVDGQRPGLAGWHVGIETAHQSAEEVVGAAARPALVDDGAKGVAQPAAEARTFAMRGLKSSAFVAEQAQEAGSPAASTSPRDVPPCLSRQQPRVAGNSAREMIVIVVSVATAARSTRAGVAETQQRVAGPPRHQRRQLATAWGENVGATSLRWVRQSSPRPSAARCRAKA